MARHTYDALLRALKQGEVAPVYYLFGQEEVLKEEATRAIVDLALDPASRDFNLDQVDASQLEPETLHALLNTLPMLGDRRVVVVRDIEAWKKKPAARGVLLRYLDRPSSNTVLLLLQSPDSEPDPDVTARALAVDVESLPPDRVLRWLGYQALRRGLSFAAGAAEHLAVVTGHDLGTLRSELEKLSGLAGTEPITVEQVGDLVGVRRGETQYDWRDAVMEDDPAKAIQLLGPVLDQSGMSGVKLVGNLAASLIGVGLARGHYDRKLRSGALEAAVFETIKRTRPFGLREWRTEARDWSRWAPRWPARRVRLALAMTLEADRVLKDTRISAELGVLTDLVFRLAGQRLEAA